MFRSLAESKRRDGRKNELERQRMRSLVAHTLLGLRRLNAGLASMPGLNCASEHPQMYVVSSAHSSHLTPIVLACLGPLNRKGISSMLPVKKRVWRPLILKR